MSQVEDQRLDEALSYYDTAIQLQPDPPKGRQAAKTARNNFFNRANLYMKLERFEDARDGFEAAIASVRKLPSPEPSVDAAVAIPSASSTSLSRGMSARGSAQAERMARPANAIVVRIIGPLVSGDLRHP